MRQAHSTPPQAAAHLDDVHHGLRRDVAHVRECPLGDKVFCGLYELFIGCGVLQHKSAVGGRVAERRVLLSFGLLSAVCR